MNYEAGYAGLRWFCCHRIFFSFFFFNSSVACFDSFVSSRKSRYFFVFQSCVNFCGSFVTVAPNRTLYYFTFDSDSAAVNFCGSITQHVRRRTYPVYIFSWVIVSMIMCHVIIDSVYFFAFCYPLYASFLLFFFCYKNILRSFCQILALQTFWVN